MSYILDSLKKSEQQRKQLERPGLHSEPIGAAIRRRNERRWWPYLLLLALLLNAALLGWYLLAVRDGGGVEIAVGHSDQPAAPPRDPQLVSHQGPLAGIPVGPTATVTIPDVERAAEPGPKPVEPAREPAREPVETNIPVNNVAEPIPYAQLPASLRQELPELVLSLHYFSGDSRSSMVRLDGVILRVGDSLQEGLSVEEINADGVVLDYRGRRISLARPRG